jgi:hypothetical protein
MVDLTLPRPGPYMAIVEFLPEGGTPQTFQQAFTTGRAFGRVPRPAVDAAPKIVDGMRVTLDVSKVKAGEGQPLIVRIDDAATGAPIADLEPAFGASGHVLLVPADLTDAIHVHPDPGMNGPALSFAPLTVRAGPHKVWVQFQRGGRVTTASFAIEIP